MAQLAAFFLFLLAFCAFVASGAKVRVSPTQKVKHGHVFLDANGRTLLFHGVNAVYKIAPWIPSTGAFDAATSLCEEDAKNLAAWGLNFVRLGVMWPGAEPQKGAFDLAYLAKVKEIVDLLGRHGIYTLLDFHQDLLNRFLCGEGIPDWALVRQSPAKHPFPWPIYNHTFPTEPGTGYPELDACLQKSFGEYYLSQEVGEAFQSFYDNAEGSRDAFADFWRQVAKTGKTSDWVVGYEIINEPFAGDVWKHPTLLVPGQADKKNLWPLYSQVHSAIREVDDETLVFFEKAITNAVGPLGFPSAPGGEEYRNRTVYSLHCYCGNVDRSGNPKGIFVCEGEEALQWLQEMHDVDSMNVGSMMTEFGAVSGNNSKSLEDLEWMCNHADGDLQSWAYWQFKSYHDITTASNSAESFYFEDGTLQKEKVNVLVRPYAQAIAGIPKSMKFERAKGHFTLEYAASKALAPFPTEIFVGPLVASGKTPSVTITPAGAATWTMGAGNRMLVTHSEAIADGTVIKVAIVSA